MTKGETKKCSGKCQEVKPIDEFYVAPRNLDRHDSQCKKCRSELNAEHAMAKKKEFELYAI